MTALTVLLIVGLLIALLNALVAHRNARRFTTLPRADDFAPDELAAARGHEPAICIPARNEEGNIEACVRAALRCLDTLESARGTVVVYDDASTDSTPAILERLASEDPRVRLPEREPLPAGWNGKQHACYRCALHAFALDETLEPLPIATGIEPASHALFIDADVRLEPDALRRSLATFYRLDARARTSAVKAKGNKPAAGLGLLSLFPRQLTGTITEDATIPLIFFILLSYLPFNRMRTTTSPSASAACGQFILVSRAAYAAADGHHSFKNSMHDGIKMPRAVRRANYHTDCYDGHDAARVRMYRGLDETWRGFTKNAYEGLGSVPLLVFITVMNIVGHVLPPIFLVALVLESLILRTPLHPADYPLALVASTIPILQRMKTADQLGHASFGAVLHGPSVLFMTAIQWRSFYLHVTGKRAWRGRTANDSAAPPNPPGPATPPTPPTPPAPPDAKTPTATPASHATT